MKVHVLYKQVWDKAEEVQDALHAVMCAWLGEADRNGIGGADYCTLRDELIALLTSDVEVVK